jgi:hypothetical protein
MCGAKQVLKEGVAFDDSITVVFSHGTTKKEIVNFAYFNKAKKFVNFAYFDKAKKL